MVTLVEQINSFVWGVPALVLILGVGVYLTVRTGFIQLRLLPEALTSFFLKLNKKKIVHGETSPFQALCTALAATVGTGNIAGVAGAIAIGGPGSVFWMWISAFLGMITKFAEATLAVYYCGRDKNGCQIGGPMYIIEKGMGKRWKWLAVIYSFFGIIAAFGIGNATQINAVVDSINSVITSFGGQRNRYIDLIIGAIFSVLLAFILLGGAARIGDIAERLVPFAAASYIIMCIAALIYNYSAIPDALKSILVGAFSPRAVTGGMLGSAFTALRIGVSRGVFTNEAGMGTAAIAHGAARVDHPAQQGLMGIMEVFIDTVVICTMTALVILCSGIDIPYGIDEGAVLTTRAFASTYGSWISVLIAVFLCCFAFATMLGWGLYGLRCAQYLFGDGIWRAFVFGQTIIIVISTLLQTGTVWMISETVNGLMAIPNLIAVAVLSPVLVRLTCEYVKLKKATHVTSFKST